MESIIIYSSMTGHSKKIANQMADSLNLKAYNIKEEKPEISDCDLLFIVSGIYGGKCCLLYTSNKGMIIIWKKEIQKS